MNENDKIDLLLKHDLHKLGFGLTHNKINRLLSNNAIKADGIAAWFSRNFLKMNFTKSPFRISLIKFSYQNNRREYISKMKLLVKKLFKLTNPIKLHSEILQSEILNLYNESKNFLYTSLKYHILLTTAFYYFLQKNIPFHRLYLNITDKMDDYSEFQVIYRNESLGNLLLTERGGISRVHPKFCYMWMRRTKISVIGGDRVLDGLLSQIPSWSCALATIEDYLEGNK
ncbi:MAG: hypothetical protein ACTSPY_18430 [Candidatus Helarchaeota archaeon]